MQKRNNNVGRGTRPRKKRQGGKKRDRPVPLYSSPGTLLPPDAMVDFKFTGVYIDNNINNVDSTSIVSNSLLQTSGWTSSTTSASLASFGRMYENYRVLGYSLKFTVIPRSATASCTLLVTDTPTIAAPSAGLSLFNAGNQSVFIEDMTRYSVGTTSTQPCLIKATRKKSMETVVGNREYKFDDTYAGTLSNTGVATSPASTTFLNFIFGRDDGAVFVVNTCPTVSAEIVFHCRLYNRRM